jgi:hypothetical protein
MLQTLKDPAIRALHLAVTLWVRHRSTIDLDARVRTKVFNLPCSEPSPIIDDNVVEYAKSIRDLLDEFHCLSRYNGGGGLHFDPLYEFIHCYDVGHQSTFGFLEWTYQI